MRVVVDARSERLPRLYENHFETGAGEDVAGNPSAGATAYYTNIEDWFAHVILELSSGEPLLEFNSGCVRSSFTGLEYVDFGAFLSGSPRKLE